MIHAPAGRRLFDLERQELPPQLLVRAPAQPVPPDEIEERAEQLAPTLAREGVLDDVHIAHVQALRHLHGLIGIHDDRPRVLAHERRRHVLDLGELDLLARAALPGLEELDPEPPRARVPPHPREHRPVLRQADVQPVGALTHAATASSSVKIRSTSAAVR